MFFIFKMLYTFVPLNLTNQVMKKVFKKSLLFIIMINLMVTYAHSKVHKNESDESKTSINFDRVKKGQKLIIKSKEGTIIYKELLDKSGTYRKEFDLTSLPNGHYYFELDKDVEIQIIPFEVNNMEVTFKKNEALWQLIEEETNAKGNESEIINFKEALIFALLGVLRSENQVNCLKSVTGAIKNHSSGKIFHKSA